MRLTKLLLLTLFVLAAGIFFTDWEQQKPLEKRKLSRVQLKKARDDYFFGKLKDPVTESIPSNVRSMEMVFSKNLNSRAHQARTQELISYSWNEVGPSNVGGRTRAIALDSRNSNIIFSGAVSGGIWKSTDGGQTWAAKLPSGSHLSITSIAQDPSTPDTWYATTGEIGTSSTSGKGNGSAYLGAGLYQSTNNGETWTLMTYASDPATGKFVKQSTPETGIARLLLSPFQLTSKIIVRASGTGSTIFVCTQWYGIWTSTDNGQSFSRFGSALSNNEDPRYCDLEMDKNGVITVWIGPTDSGNNGFFRSYDGGANFTNVSPVDYPTTTGSARTVMALSPSNPAIMYAFVFDGSDADAGLHLYAYDFTGQDGGGSATITNLTANLPLYSRTIFGDGNETLTSQGGYDMILAVHPTNPLIAVLGYVNLVKTVDGFQTTLTGDPAASWIGGNDNPWLLDEGINFNGVHHADQHIAVFDPASPNVLLSGHDGGLSKTLDITASRVVWQTLNHDYNVTQYYSVSAGFNGTSSYLIGGTQDNGTPLLAHATFTSALLPTQGDLSSGDGAFCFAGDQIMYASSQNGSIRIHDVAATYIGDAERTDLQRLFIHPFAVDPNDQGTMFYSTNGDGIIARNTQFDESVAAQDISIVNNNWEDFNFIEQVGITAIRVSNQSPSHKLYFGGAGVSGPVLYTWDNANTAVAGVNPTGRTLTEVQQGSYLNDIAINPLNGNEIMLIYSNYNVVSLYHSTDGGVTLTAIEGNLGTGDNLGDQGFSGPSIRAGEIAVDASGNKKYFVATSIGLYHTEALNGANTVWVLSTPLLDNVVIEDLDFRFADKALAVGTHGRGMFMGKVSNANTAPVIAAQTFTIDERLPNGTTVGTVAATDAENNPLTFAIKSGNTGEAFAIDGATGVMTVKSTEAIQFNTNPTFALGVEVSDGSLTAEAVITVNLNFVLGVAKPEMVVSVYPVPVNAGTIFLQLPQTNQDIRISLVSLSGQETLLYAQKPQSERLELDVSGFKGLYVLTIETDIAMSRKRVIIN